MDFHKKNRSQLEVLWLKAVPAHHCLMLEVSWHEQQRVAINSTTQTQSGNLSEIMFFKTHCLVPRKGTDCAASVLGEYGTNKSLPFLLLIDRIS